MNKKLKFIGLCIALGSNFLWFYFIGQFFLSPKKQILIHEPSRLISGFEILLLIFSVVIIYRLIWDLKK